MTGISWFPPSVSTEELIRLFEQAAIAYGIAEFREDTTESVRLDEVKYEIIREVQRRGQEAKAMLLLLMHHENPYVRAESAMYAIHFAPSDAVPVLTDIAKLRGPIGFYARKVLNRYLVGADDPQSGP